MTCLAIHPACPQIRVDTGKRLLFNVLQEVLRVVVQGLQDVEEGGGGVQRVQEVAATLLPTVVRVGHEGLVVP